MIEVKHECKACKGTGLYQGMSEPSPKVAVVCSRCQGQGFVVQTFEEFTGRKDLPGVERVFQTNPGIGIGEGKLSDGSKITLQDFGGIALDDWKAGKGFPIGTEMRKWTCPRWWGQSAEGGNGVYGNGKVNYYRMQCHASLGMSFSECPCFKDKHVCWLQADEQVNKMKG